MTQQEFEAVLALHGWELIRIDHGQVAIARIIAPIQPDDVSQGPYRYDGMVRVVGEIGATSWTGALNALIELYQQGHMK